MSNPHTYHDDPFQPQDAGRLNSTTNYRDSHSDLQDYWDDGQLPPPHRLSGTPAGASADSLHRNPFDSDTNLPGHTYDPDPYTRTLHDNASTPAINMNTSRFDTPYGNSGYNDLDAAAQRAQGGGSSAWLEKEQTRGRRNRLLMVGGIAVAAILIVGGIIAGVVIAKSHKSSSSSPSSTNSTTSLKIGTPDPNSNYFAVVQQTDANDPSTFQKDPNLSNSFYALAYTPFGSQIPNCGANLRAVIEDVQLISQLTNKIRLYGADCNQSMFVLDAIQRTKVDLSVFLGNYVLPDDDAGYTRQRDEITQAIQTFGVDHVSGITVGNEFMLNYLNAHGNGVSDPNSPVGNQGAQYLNSKIADTKSVLQGLNLKKTIPVGTSDAGAFFNNEVLAAVDYGMANVHPWFANTSITDAASWTTSFFQNTDIAAANGVPNKPAMYIAETGWPTGSKDPGSGSDGPSTASVANLQTYLDTFVCSSNQNNTNYFFFEMFDEPWKDAQFGGVEGYWGIFNYNKTLKAGLKTPTCSHS